MVNAVLKKIFPRAFLKDAFLLYNKVRMHTVDRILFPEQRINRNDFLLYRTGFPFRENGMDVSALEDPVVRTYMERWNDWTQEEFILIFKGSCWIEPDFGWALVSPSRLIYYSLGISRTPFQKKPGIYGLLKKKHTLRLRKAISLRDTGEENYFHFYNDVLAKIFFLKQNGISVETQPVIISAALWNKPYFQHYYKHSEVLRSLHWIVQDKQYIQCDETVFCKPLTHRMDLLQEIRKPFGEIASGYDRIFVTRSRQRLRYLENAAEIESLCEKNGFRIVDSDLLSMEDQVTLFQKARCVIGIHGAGLTNMMFRKEPCHILEIFPPPATGYLPFHYIMLAKMLGFQYQAVIGQKSQTRYSGGFILPIATFGDALRKFLIACQQPGY